MKPPFFRLRRSRLNGIISPPYPEVTLDTFGFPVGGRLAARRTVSWPRLPKVALSGPQNAVFWPEIIFLCPASKKIVTIIAGHLKDNLFVLTALQGGLRGAVGARFWPKNCPKIIFFYATPIKPTFFGLRRTRLNGIITSPYPEVTLDTFGFPLGARSAARRAVSWPRLPKVALLGPKNAVFLARNQFFCGQPQNRLLQS